MTPAVVWEKKTDDEPLQILNETRQQVTTHTTLTENAPTNDCARYFDIGQEKEERDVSSDLQASIDDKCKKRSPPQASKPKKVKVCTRLSDLLPKLPNSLPNNNQNKTCNCSTRN